MASPYIGANGVLRNKFGITNAARLRRIEYALTSSRSNEILRSGALRHLHGFGLARQQAIHHHLFQDVYDWAGKIRTVPSSKSLGIDTVSPFAPPAGTVSVFARPEDIVGKWQTLEQHIHAFVHADSLTFAQQCETLAEIFIEANHVHPFPEGNGRSLQIFMQLLAREHAVTLDFDAIDARAWNTASAISGTHGMLVDNSYLIPYPPNHEPIHTTFSEMARPSRDRNRTR
jgi:cell filamentation protein